MKPLDHIRSPAWPEVLLPWVIARTVCDEVSRFLDVEIPDRHADWLSAKADQCFARNRRFRTLMRGRGNAPRDWLYAYMRHWLSALLDAERPDLWYCLPPEFDLGHPLPCTTEPRVNRRGRRPLPPPLNWDPERALARPSWRFLRPADEPLRPARRVPCRGRPRPVHPRVQESDEPAGPFRVEEWPVLA